MSVPYRVSFDLDSKKAKPIVPGFPRWDESFVSGKKSTLFSVAHSISIEDDQLLFSRVHFLDHSEGPPGHVHGGATAGLIDEVMGILVWHHRYASVTQSIQIHYRKAIPLDMTALLLTRLISVHEKTVEVHCTVYDEAKTAYVTAQGIFHRLSESQLARFKDKT